MNGRVHSREFKLQLVRQMANGEKRPAQVCREYGIAESLLARWRKEYAQRGEAAFMPKELAETDALKARIAELERFCGQLALENAVLKKAVQQAVSRSDTK
jgi:putative transposase